MSTQQGRLGENKISARRGRLKFFFHAHLPCCALIFFHVHLPCCALIFFAFFFSFSFSFFVFFFFGPSLQLFFFFFLRALTLLCHYPALRLPCGALSAFRFTPAVHYRILLVSRFSLRLPCRALLLFI